MKKILYAYDMLVGKEIKCYANNKEYLLEFSYSNLKHLLGLQHIKDNNFIKDMNASDVVKNIKNGKLNYDKLSKSNQFDFIQERLENFYYFSNFLLSNYYVKYKTYLIDFPNTRMDFDYLLMHKSIKDNNKFMYLGVREESKENNKLIPVTYLIKDNDNFKKDDIYKIELSKKSKKIKS